MRPSQLFLPFLLFALAIPLWGQAQPRSEVNSLLEAANKALDHYQRIAPSIHCEEATTAAFRDACKIVLATMAERVQEGRAEIARYRQNSRSQAVDLFDAYEVFRRIMIELEVLNSVPEAYGERNQAPLAEAYNTFVKVTGWFEGVVRESIQEEEKCTERAGHS
jgi:hypothetical protein